MINFLLKYTGTYGLLAILAIAIVTPTYFFLTSKQELLPESSAEKQDVSNEEKVIEKTVLPEKMKESADETSDEAKQKEPTNQENKEDLEQVLSPASVRHMTSARCRAANIHPRSVSVVMTVFVARRCVGVQDKSLCPSTNSLSSTLSSDTLPSMYGF